MSGGIRGVDSGEGSFAVKACPPIAYLLEINLVGLSVALRV